MLLENLCYVKTEILPNQKILPTGIEPVTFSSGGWGNVVVSADNTGLTASPAGRCTNGCTGNDDRLDVIARAVALVAALPLTEAERAEVVRRIVEEGGGVGTERNEQGSNIPGGRRMNPRGV